MPDSEDAKRVLLRELYNEIVERFPSGSHAEYIKAILDINDFPDSELIRVNLEFISQGINNIYNNSDESSKADALRLLNKLKELEDN